MKFCIGLSPATWARDERGAATRRTIALAQAADQAGIDAVWVSEDPDGWDACAVLGAIAMQTERIRLGPGVVNGYFRHPALIAASGATLDRLSNGRAFLGIGRGQPEWYERSLGIEVGSPLDHLRESIDLLRQWWSDERAATSSSRASAYNVHAWERSFGPHHRVPIYIAAVGPKALDLAADVADGVVFNDLASLTFMQDAITRIQNRRGSLDGFEVFARVNAVLTDDPASVYESRKATVALIHALPHMEALLQTPGIDTDRIITDVRRVMKTDEVLARGGAFADLRRAGDLEAAKRAIPSELMEHLVVAGDATAVRDRLAALASIGVTHTFLAPPPATADLAVLHETVQALQ